jgi:dihydroorotate dehydrogenase
MTLYQKYIFPLLVRVDPERAHDVTLRLLDRADGNAVGRLYLRLLAGRVPRQPVHAFGLTFRNALGVAAGYDKDAVAPLGLARLGVGHVEVGTVTPWAQAGNARPRVFRLEREWALINRMGFPNEGMARVSARLRRLREGSRPWPDGFVLGVSVGKQKETALADAAEDYLLVMRAVYPYADYLALNVSSPNTPGLRQLQGRAYLEQLLGAVQEESARLGGGEGRLPMLVKIAPDLTQEEIDQILEAADRSAIDGIIATNTTVTRPGVTAQRGAQMGGLSGAPLAARSLEVVQYVCSQLADRRPVIAVGGVMNADDVKARLDAGARLVQIYTAFVYEGPRLPGRIVRALAKGPRA